MKRLAGENGNCWASLNFLAKKMGANRKTVAKNIKKLLKRKWVMEISPVKIRGGKIRQFKIVDLWQLNMKEYESGAKKDIVKVGLLFPEVGLIRTRGGANKDTKKNQEEYILRRYSSSKKLPYYKETGESMRYKDGRWYVIPMGGGTWLEFADSESKIEYK